MFEEKREEQVLEVIISNKHNELKRNISNNELPRYARTDTDVLMKMDEKLLTKAVRGFPIKNYYFVTEQVLSNPSSPRGCKKYCSCMLPLYEALSNLIKFVYMYFIKKPFMDLFWPSGFGETRAVKRFVAIVLVLYFVLCGVYGFVSALRSHSWQSSKVSSIDIYLILARTFGKMITVAFLIGMILMIRPLTSSINEVPHYKRNNIGWKRMHIDMIFISFVFSLFHTIAHILRIYYNPSLVGYEAFFAVTGVILWILMILQALPYFCIRYNKKPNNVTGNKQQKQVNELHKGVESHADDHNKVKLQIDNKDEANSNVSEQNDIKNRKHKQDEDNNNVLNENKINQNKTDKSQSKNCAYFCKLWFRLTHTFFYLPIVIIYLFHSSTFWHCAIFCLWYYFYYIYELQVSETYYHNDGEVVTLICKVNSKLPGEYGYYCKVEAADVAASYTMIPLKSYVRNQSLIKFRMRKCILSERITKFVNDVRRDDPVKFEEVTIDGKNFVKIPQKEIGFHVYGPYHSTDMTIKDNNSKQLIVMVADAGITVAESAVAFNLAKVGYWDSVIVLHLCGRTEPSETKLLKNVFSGNIQKSDRIESKQQLLNKINQKEKDKIIAIQFYGSLTSDLVVSLLTESSVLTHFLICSKVWYENIQNAHAARNFDADVWSRIHNEEFEI